MTILINFLLPLLLSIIAPQFLPKVISVTMDRKQRQNLRDYPQYRSVRHSDKFMNIVMLALASIISLKYNSLGTAALLITLSYIALYIVRIDQQYRIIPNEAILVIAIIGVIYQAWNAGLEGILSGLLALVFSTLLFFGTAFITHKLSGSIGVGAGDIKLVAVLSFFVGANQVLMLLIGIVVFLVAYLVIGTLMKRISIGSSFPMGTQIMGGFMLVIYYPFIFDLLEILI